LFLKPPSVTTRTKKRRWYIARQCYMAAVVYAGNVLLSSWIKLSITVHVGPVFVVIFVCLDLPNQNWTRVWPLRSTTASCYLSFQMWMFGLVPVVSTGWYV
jgi:hypothetical protein